MPDVGRGRVDDRDEPPPQLRLPEQVRVEGRVGSIGVAPLAPVGEHPRAALPVAVEEPREPQRHRVAASGSHLVERVIRVGAVAEVPAQRLAPGLPERGVDDLEQRPDEVLRQPRVVRVAPGEHRDERPGPQEGDPCADAVATPFARPEPVGEALRQPPLDALLGHDDDLLREGVGQRARQQLTELVGEGVGALRAVEVKCHGQTVSAQTDNARRTVHTLDRCLLVLQHATVGS